MLFSTRKENGHAIDWRNLPAKDIAKVICLLFFRGFFYTVDRKNTRQPKGDSKMRDIGKNIRDFRMKNGMNQEELAAKLFVTRQTVSNYENGKSRPDVDMLLSIAAVFGIDVNVLIYGENNEKLKADAMFAVLSAAAMLAAGVLLGVYLQWTKMYTSQTYSLHPHVLSNFILCPVYAGVCGFLIARIICLFTKPRYTNVIPQALRTAIGIAVLAWMIFQLIYPVQMFFWEWSLAGLEEVNATFYGFLYPLGEKLFLRFTLKYRWLYFFYGAVAEFALRKARKERNKAQTSGKTEGNAVCTQNS